MPYFLSMALTTDTPDSAPRIYSVGNAAQRLGMFVADFKTKAQAYGQFPVWMINDVPHYSAQSIETIERLEMMKKK